MVLVDDALLVGAIRLFELIGIVLILVVALGGQVRPPMWLGRQALRNVQEHIMFLLRVGGVLIRLLLKCKLCLCRPSFQS